jgi:hypothetical protein
VPCRRNSPDGDPVATTSNRNRQKSISHSAHIRCRQAQRCRLTACNAQTDPDDVSRSVNPAICDERSCDRAPCRSDAHPNSHSARPQSIQYLKLTTFCQLQGPQQGRQRNPETKWTVLTANALRNWPDSPDQTPLAARRSTPTTQGSKACRWSSSYVGSCHPWITFKAHMPWTWERDPLLKQEAA